MASPTQKIAKLLGTDSKRAAEFGREVQSSLGTAVKFQMIVDVLPTLKQHERTVENVVNKLAGRLPAKEFRGAKAKKLILWLPQLTAQVQQQLSDPVNETAVYHAVHKLGSRDVDKIVARNRRGPEQRGSSCERAKHG